MTGTWVTVRLTLPSPLPAGILKIAPEDQKLSDEQGQEVYHDDKTLSDYNMTGQTARAHTPAAIGLAVR